MTDLFLSYRTRRRDEVQPLLQALAAQGCEVWRDEARVDGGHSISEAVRAGLSGSRGLLVWASEDYHESRICQIELRAAWISAEQAGPPEERVVVVLPAGVRVDRLPPLGVEADLRHFPAPEDPADSARWTELARRLVEHLPRDGRRLGELRPILARTSWFPHPKYPSPRFVGRQREIWQLHARLQQERRVAITGVQRGAPVRLQGLGGVGKSCLAIEYATLFEAAWPGGIYYQNLSDGQDPQRREAELALCLGLGGSTDAERSAALRRHLCSSTEPYLWLLDGVPAELSQAEVEQRCAPGGPGQSLLTTRSRAWTGLGQGLDLDVLAPDEALQLLLWRRDGQPVHCLEAARQLCAKVGHLPLALDLLAALQKQRPGEEGEWLRKLDDPDKDALEMAMLLQEELPTGCSRSVAAVLDQSLRSLRSQESWTLLLFLAVLAEAQVPESPIEKLMGEAPCIEALSELRAHSLLPEETLSMHALLRRALLRMDGRTEERERGRLRLLRLWKDTLESVNVDDMRSHGPILDLLPHVEALAGTCSSLEEAGLLIAAARLWNVRGAWRAARKSWERALEAQRQILGDEDPVTLATRQNLGVALNAQGDFSGALTHLERAWWGLRRILGPKHLNTLVALLNIANALYSMGEFHLARNLQQRVWKRQRRILGPEHPDSLKSLQNLANTSMAMGDLAEARTLQEQVLDAQRRVLEPEHPDIFRTLHNLALTHLAQGELTGARTLFEQALDGHTRILGPEHPDTLATLSSLANTLSAQGDPAGARLLQKQALVCRSSALGPAHPHTLSSLSNLALPLIAQGDLSGGRELLEQALEARGRVLGPEHPDTRATRCMLVLTLLLIDPAAAAPHVQYLADLEVRAPEVLSPMERQFLAELRELWARLP